MDGRDKLVDGAEFQDLLDLGPHERVVHVEIRLLDSEQVQIILLPQIVPLPGFALKMAVLQIFLSEDSWKNFRMHL